MDYINISDLNVSLTEAHLSALIPILAFWVSATAYEVIDHYNLLPQYRLPVASQTQKKEKKESPFNPSKSQVIRHVLFLHSIQILLEVGVDCLGIGVGEEGEEEKAWSLNSIWRYQHSTDDSLRSTLSHGAVLLARQLLALIVIDTWVFWMHYTMHKVPWLYRNIHSAHHKIDIPYAYAAMYNSFAEAVLIDMLGCLLSQILLDLSSREAIFLFTFATMKVVDDHSGYAIPWAPGAIFGKMTGCDGAWHDVHHKSWGRGRNFANYFGGWDWVMGTAYIPGDGKTKTL
ncbi:hypothetical protein BDV18DRAFT_159662 [Aspergillus unguis]